MTAHVSPVLCLVPSLLYWRTALPLSDKREARKQPPPVDTDREGCLGEGLSIPYIKAGNLCFISAAVNGRALNANVSVRHPRTDRLSPPASRQAAARSPSTLNPVNLIARRKQNLVVGDNDNDVISLFLLKNLHQPFAAARVKSRCWLVEQHDAWVL